jgi:hypothetical protein
MPQETAFFVALDGHQAGPFDRAKLQEVTTAGKLTPTTLVWAHGMPKWTPASEVPALADLFTDAPPPLPPA